MRWKRLAVFVSAAALATAAACGGDAPSERAQEDEKTAEPQDTSVVGEATDAEAKAPAAEVEGAQEGGTLSVLTWQAPHTLDPTRAYYVDSTSIMRLVTRGLTMYQYRDGKMVLVPDMATDLGQPNEDFTQWTFTLRDGLKYEDGAPVTSEDIAYAIKRQFATEELPDGPTYSQDNFVDGDKYVGPFKPAKANAEGQFGGDEFKGVETPDDKTIVMKLRKPFADMPFYASFPNFTGIPQAKDTQEDYESHPMATGPYKFEKYTPEKELILVKNDQWDPATDTTRHQYIDRYEFKFAQDQVRIQTQLINDEGEDQTAMTYDDVLAENMPKITGTDVEDRLVKGRNTCTYYWWMDARKIPLEVRKAVAVAWPTESEWKVGGEVVGLTRRPGTSIMSSLTPGWKEFDVVGNGGKGDGDPVKAKKMLEDAGELGFELSWYFAQNDPIAPKVTEIRKQKLEAAGFKAKARPTTLEKRRELDNDPDAPINLRSSGWCLDWPSGASVFPAQWYPPKIDDPGVTNPAFLDEPELTKKIDDISAMPIEEGLPAWGDLDEEIMEKYMPIVPVGEDGDAWLHGSKIGNPHHDEYLGMPDWTQLYLMQ